VLREAAMAIWRRPNDATTTDASYVAERYVPRVRYDDIATPAAIATVFLFATVLLILNVIQQA
jgi:hypothetical protein